MMKRLKLPGGGFFEIQMPRGGGRFVPAASLSGVLPQNSAGGKIVAVGVGALLGAVLTWALVEILE